MNTDYDVMVRDGINNVKEVGELLNSKISKSNLPTCIRIVNKSIKYIKCLQEVFTVNAMDKMDKRMSRKLVLLYLELMDAIVDLQQNTINSLMPTVVETDLVESDPFVLLKYIYRYGCLSLSDTSYTYDSSQHDGFVYKDRLYIPRQRLAECVNKLRQNGHKYSQTQIIRYLSEKNAIMVREYSNRAYYTHGCSLQRAANIGNKRFVVIYLNMLIDNIKE